MTGHLARFLFAWYNVTASATPTASSKVSAGTTTSLASLTGLDVEFQLDADKSVKLTNASGDTYVWNGQQNVLQSAELDDLYGTVTITVKTIKLTGGNEDIKGTAATMKQYYGTYNMKVQLDEGVASNAGRLSLNGGSAPASKAAVGAFGTSALNFELVIDSNGGYSITGLNGTNHNQFYFAVTGSDSIHNGSEAAGFIAVIR